MRRTEDDGRGMGEEIGGGIRLPDHLYGAMSTDRRPLNDNRIYQGARYAARPAPESGRGNGHQPGVICRRSSVAGDGAGVVPRRSCEDGGTPDTAAVIRRASLPRALRVAASRRQPAPPTRGRLRAGAAALGIGLVIWLVCIAVAAALYPEVWSQVPVAAVQAVWQ